MLPHRPKEFDVFGMWRDYVDRGFVQSVCPFQSYERCYVMVFGLVLAKIILRPTHRGLFLVVEGYFLVSGHNMVRRCVRLECSITSEKFCMTVNFSKAGQDDVGLEFLLGAALWALYDGYNAWVVHVIVRRHCRDLSLSLPVLDGEVEHSKLLVPSTYESFGFFEVNQPFKAGVVCADDEILF